MLVCLLGVSSVPPMLWVFEKLEHSSESSENGTSYTEKSEHPLLYEMVRPLCVLEMFYRSISTRTKGLRELETKILSGIANLKKIAMKISHL